MCSMKKGVLRNFTKFTGKHLCHSLFLNLRPATSLKKRLWHRCFPVIFVKFLRTPFLQNTSGRLLLNTYSRCGAGLQPGTSPWFHFLRFLLLGTPIFRNTWECFLFIYFFSHFFWLQCVKWEFTLFVSVCLKKSGARYCFLHADYF